MHTRATLAAVLLTLLVSHPRAQTPVPAFEAATIKRNTSGEFGGSFGVRPGGLLVVTNNAVRNMIRNAWGLQNYQIVGGPDWVENDRYDITARAAGNPTPDEMRLMVQRLLADRFKLVARMERRDIPVYALVVDRPDGRLGPQLRKAPVDCRAIAADAQKRGVQPEFPPQPGDRPACGTRSMPGVMMTTGVTMADVARNLANPAGRMVVDRTGLAGAWDLDLKYMFDGPLPPGIERGPAEGASLFAALQEQLGLRLQADTAPVEVLVIDSIERPTED